MTVKRTRLCYWIARLAKPGVQSSNASRVRFTIISHTPGRSHVYHMHIVSKPNWDGACLMHLTQKSYLFFTFAACSIALLTLGETCPLKGRDMVTVWRTLSLLRWCDCSALWRHVVWTRIVVSHNHEWVLIIHYQTWIAHGRFIAITCTPSKQWGVCDNNTGLPRWPWSNPVAVSIL